MTAIKTVQRELINIYCDESCHLERDGEPIMVLGAVSCPAAAVKQTHREILEIIGKSNSEAAEVLTKRFGEGLGELKTAAKI